MTNEVSPPSVMANTTSLLFTPRSLICFFPKAVKSSKPSTALMSAKSPPAITGNARLSQSLAAGELLCCQKSRQMEASWMLNRPVEPQPVK